MKLEEIAVVRIKPRSAPTAPPPVDDVEETLFQLAYDHVDSEEAFACMYVVAGEMIHALHRMVSHNPLYVERLNQSLLQSAERAKAERTKAN